MKAASDSRIASVAAVARAVASMTVGLSFIAASITAPIVTGAGD